MKKMFLFILLLSCFIGVSCKQKQVEWTEVSKDSWKQVVVGALRPVIVYVSSSTCLACRAMDKVMYSLYKDLHYKYDFVKIDFQSNGGFCIDALHVKALPTFIFFMDGLESGRYVGVLGKNEFKQLLYSFFYS